MALDTFVAQIAFRARLLERAVHDDGPWTIRFEAGKLLCEVPAQREFLEDGVAFHADFPALMEMDGPFHLCWKGEAYSSKVMTAHEVPFRVNWAIQGVVSDNQPAG